MEGKDWYLRITSFGGFSICACTPPKGTPAGPVLPDKKTWSRKMWHLVKYLIFADEKGVAVSELVDRIWPQEGCVADPVRSLRLLVHRARLELDKLGPVKGADLIRYGNGLYSWNRSVPAEIDANVFQRCYLDSRSGDDASRLGLLMRAVRLYRGPFLSEEASSPWAVLVDTSYHSEYTSMCLEASEILQRLGRPWEVIDLCGRALAVDPYEDGLHAAVIRSLAEVGAVNEAKEHYRKTAELYRNDLDVSPGREMGAAYEAVLKNEDTKSADVLTIQADLNRESAGGAFYCEYDDFRKLYCLKREECSRSGLQVQMSLISLVPAAGRAHRSDRQKKLMQETKEIIRRSLRKGDIFSRYSMSQYILLLQFASTESGVVALNRIQRNFRKTLPKSDFLLQCKILPLPVERQPGENRAETKPAPPAKA